MKFCLDDYTGEGCEGCWADIPWITVAFDSSFVVLSLSTSRSMNFGAILLERERERERERESKIRFRR